MKTQEYSESVQPTLYLLSVALRLCVKQGILPSELPPWMKFLQGKLANPATPLNIRLFISKLIINTEEVITSQVFCAK